MRVPWLATFRTLVAEDAVLGGDALKALVEVAAARANYCAPVFDPLVVELLDIAGVCVCVCWCWWVGGGATACVLMRGGGRVRARHVAQTTERRPRGRARCPCRCDRDWPSARVPPLTTPHAARRRSLS